jgi:CheY-like chemotaxis protein
MVRTADGWTKVTVEDQGRGFDAEALRTRQVLGGAFGLFSIQQRLAHIGGRLEIESAPGRGARIHLLTPPAKASAVVSQPPLPASAPEAETARAKGSRIRVLIVDDHKIMRQGLARLLQLESDMEIVGEAADGREAVELARRLDPDVIIMDVNLPVMNGVEATQLILKHLPHTRVIGLSMHIDRNIAADMQKAGAVGYLTKGGPSEALIDAIRACTRSDRSGA